MPKPIYTFLMGTQLIHAKADLHFKQQKYNIFFYSQLFLEQIQQSIATPNNGALEAKMTVGVKKKTGMKIQYCITALET